MYYSLRQRLFSVEATISLRLYIPNPLEQRKMLEKQIFNIAGRT